MKSFADYCLLRSGCMGDHAFNAMALFRGRELAREGAGYSRYTCMAQCMAFASKLPPTDYGFGVG
jgi:hypothetical protein